MPWYTRLDGWGRSSVIVTLLAGDGRIFKLLKAVSTSKSGPCTPCNRPCLSLSSGHTLSESKNSIGVVKLSPILQCITQFPCLSLFSLQQTIWEEVWNIKQLLTIQQTSCPSNNAVWQDGRKQETCQSWEPTFPSPGNET